MRATTLAQSLCATLQHQPHGRRDRAELSQLAATQRARVDVGQQTRFFENAQRHCADVIDCTAITAGTEPLPGRAIAKLRFFTQSQEHLTAAGCRPFSHRGEDVIELKIQRIELGGCFGKGAVVTDIAAQLRNRDEDLWAKGHIVRVVLIPQGTCARTPHVVHR